MDDGQAIFRSTSQALHFAYLIEAYEASAESIMAKVLRIHMMEFGIWDDGVPSTVNFGGLNALEVRAQCAMIRAAVRDRLPEQEAWAIQACYGRNDAVIEERGDGRRKRRPVFSCGRYESVLNFSHWIAPSFPNFNPLAVFLLVAHAVDRRVARMTFREMEERCGIAKSTLHDGMERVTSLFDGQVRIALGRLGPVFRADGLVEP